MKIRVYRSDGVFRGGLFKTHVFNNSNCRVWHGPPHPHYFEQLIDISGHSNPSTEHSWFILQFSRNPDITEGADPEDNFDGASMAIQITPVEAIRWFDESVYYPPPDLVELARGFDEMCYDFSDDENNPSLSESLQEVWDVLKNRAISGKQIAIELLGDFSKEDAIRKRISEIRKTGRTINRRQGFGYYRPDAPPPDF